MGGRKISGRPSVLEDHVTIKEENLLLVVSGGLLIVFSHSPVEVGISIESNNLLEERGGD